MHNNNKLVGDRLTYQHNKLTAAMRYVPADRRRVAVDVGAHVGLWSMHLVDLFEAVHAFEPNAEMHECFYRNVLHSNFVLHGCALGADQGRCGLREFDASTGHTMNTGVTKTGAIAMEKLDSFNLQDVDFVKIDVEGYEYAVVLGASETLLRCRPVVVCEDKGHGHAHGIPEGAAIKFLKKLGMEVRENIGGDHIMVFP